MRILNDNVLVTDIEDMADKVGDIFLPDAGMQYGYDEDASARRYDCKIGTVVDFGPDAVNLKKGQKCYLAPLKGKEFTCNGKEFRLYRYEEVFGVIE